MYQLSEMVTQKENVIEEQPLRSTCSGNLQQEKDHVKNGDDNNLDSTAATNEYVLNVAFFSFLLFMVVQGTFSVVAKSQAMWADTMAMSVDALTYLFNLLAERLKHTNLFLNFIYGTKLPEEEIIKKRKELRLYLEFIIPVISITALIIVSTQTFIDAIKTIIHDHGDANDQDYHDQVEVADEPNVNLMLFFSGLNLLLDILNVTCFAKATNFTLSGGIGLSSSSSSSTPNNMSGGMKVRIDEEDDTEQLSSDESSQNKYNNHGNKNNKIQVDVDVEMNICSEADFLLDKKNNEAKCRTCNYGSDHFIAGDELDDKLSLADNNCEQLESINQNDDNDNDCISVGSNDSLDSDTSEAISEKSTELLNLNMCSAYTHVMADTLRSIAVLIAAGIARSFDGIDPSIADASASIVVSFIIAISLGPLVVGLLETLKEITIIWKAKRRNKRNSNHNITEKVETQLVFLEDFQSLPHGIYKS